MKRGTVPTQTKRLEDLTPEELVIAILKGGEIKKLPGSFLEIHGAFAELKMAYPKILERFVFNPPGSLIYSQLLEEALYNVLGSRIIGYQSDLDIHGVHHGPVTRKVLESLGPKDQETMKGVGATLMEILEKIGH